MKQYNLFFVVVIILFVLLGTAALLFVKAVKPVIDSMVPSDGPVGTIITIQGHNFTKKDNSIHFFTGGVNTDSIDGNTLTFQIPETVGPCDFAHASSQYTQCMTPSQFVIPGTYYVYITNSNGKSNSITFKVDAPPNQNSVSCTTDHDCQKGETCMVTGPLIANQPVHKVCVAAGQVVPL